MVKNKIQIHLEELSDAVSLEKYKPLLFIEEPIEDAEPCKDSRTLHILFQQDSNYYFRNIRQKLPKKSGLRVIEIRLAEISKSACPGNSPSVKWTYLTWEFIPVYGEKEVLVDVNGGDTGGGGKGSVKL